MSDEEKKNSNDNTQIELDLSTTSIETLATFVEEASDEELFREIFEKNKTRYDVLKVLLDNPNTPDDIRQEVASVISLPVPTAEALAQERKKIADMKAKDIQKERLVMRIAKMSISEKIKIAMKGNSEARGILSKDANKLVLLSVLDNARITITEIEAMARNRSILDDALRVIAKNKEWTKNYAVVHALVTNPKTPPAISMRFLPTLKKRDMGLLTKNKNVSEAVRSMAKKFTKKGQG
jgi:hypothetical protein